MSITTITMTTTANKAAPFRYQDQAGNVLRNARRVYHFAVLVTRPGQPEVVNSFSGTQASASGERAKVLRHSPPGTTTRQLEIEEVLTEDQAIARADAFYDRIDRE